jgi:ribose-phosphate pyrophosphokinase
MENSLDLVYPENPYSLEYKVTKFPDGQQSITITDPMVMSNDISEIVINSRLSSFLDLELIICATQALKEIGFKVINLRIPYVLGARSDRKFELGSINYIKTVIAPIINSQEYNKVFVLDPHSDVIEACINNVVITSNVVFASRQIFDLVINSEETGINNRVTYHEDILNNLAIISPDAGSNKKIKDLMKKVCSGWASKYDVKLIKCDKTRELSTGKITGFEVYSNNVKGKHCVIVDDICDGGGTFIGLAAKLKELGAESVYLVVTHGIFSKGIEPLLETIDGVFCTDSYDHGIEHEKLTTINCAFKYR